MYYSSIIGSGEYIISQMQGLDDMDKSISSYREVLKSDSTSVEAIACIATHHFYSDQPEIALSYYR